MQKKIITNAKLILPNSAGKFYIAEKSVVFAEKILQIGSTADAEIIDAENNFVAPGFINLHIHGCNNADTMDATPDALQKMCDYLPCSGVTGFLPTTMTMQVEKIKSALKNIGAGKFTGAKILGVNLEGPFISAEYCGAQDKQNILRADFEVIAEFADLIKLITIAPEVTDKNFIAQCLDANIIVSIGHSAASYEIAMQAIERGASHITHLFNAQTGLHHRRAGIVGAAFNSSVKVEVIADNVHIAPAVQKIVSKIKPVEEIILITDSCRACGIGDGESELGGQKIFVKDNVATLENGNLAASVAKLNEVVGNFYRNTDLNLAEVIETVTKNPAQELKIYNEVGSIEVGKAADLVIFDSNFAIKKTFINGAEVFSS